MIDKKTKRVLRWYKKNGDDLVAEEEFAGFDLKILQRLFNQSVNNPMYDCYAVEGNHVEFLQKFVTHRIDINSYDYFVEYPSKE